MRGTERVHVAYRKRGYVPRGLFQKSLKNGSFEMLCPYWVRHEFHFSFSVVVGGGGYEFVEAGDAMTKRRSNHESELFLYPKRKQCWGM